MYRRILVPLEHSPYDDAILRHVRQLARLCDSALVLIHVADGWAARNMGPLALRDSEEIRDDRAYLERCAAELREADFPTDAVLAAGDPATEIVKAAAREQCDLIAMATHGHKWLGDLIHGSTASAVRHATEVPVLLVRVRPTGSAAPAD
jgi:nucleotide-binding universal stress UspA family protein